MRRGCFQGGRPSARHSTALAVRMRNGAARARSHEAQAQNIKMQVRITPIMIGDAATDAKSPSRRCRRLSPPSPAWPAATAGCGSKCLGGARRRDPRRRAHAMPADRAPPPGADRRRCAAASGRFRSSRRSAARRPGRPASDGGSRGRSRGGCRANGRVPPCKRPSRFDGRSVFRDSKGRSDHKALPTGRVLDRPGGCASRTRYRP